MIPGTRRLKDIASMRIQTEGRSSTVSYFHFPRPPILLHLHWSIGFPRTDLGHQSIIRFQLINHILILGG
uniref:Uncharacterized protein n=1 Tax=Physcomitrium patens TaxID=3218 RepID=A0A2K1L9W7_PHYPA|nr:hypothetical protein PHYPA_001246 [Physcomitrium patens]